MTIDLSKAVAGMTVHFRCGGSAKIVGVHLTLYGVFLYFDGVRSERYKNDGIWSSEETLWDIIRIEDPPFEWKYVKPGMAFTYCYPGMDNEVVYYTWHSYNEPRFSMAKWDCPQSLELSYLTRCPARDQPAEIPR